ncbi:MAG: hypothetical protein HXS48_19235 [Theionarchaea archaeon]|nr:hypothetical protein [Theionarchaea archaeon]
MIGRVNPPEAQQTIAPIISFLNTRPLKWRAHIPITFHLFDWFSWLYMFLPVCQSYVNVVVLQPEPLQLTTHLLQLQQVDTATYILPQKRETS